jgi:hypothetical protein
MSATHYTITFCAERKVLWTLSEQQVLKAYPILVSECVMGLCVQLLLMEDN